VVNFCAAKLFGLVYVMPLFVLVLNSVDLGTLILSDDDDDDTCDTDGDGNK